MSNMTDEELIAWAKSVGIPPQFWDPTILRKIKQYRETLETGVARVVSTDILVGEFWRVKVRDSIATSIIGLTKDNDLVQIIVRDILDEDLGVDTFIKSPFSLGETLWVDRRQVNILGEKHEDAWKIFENVKLYENIEDIPFGELGRIRGLLVFIRENTSIACARCHSHNIRDGICQKCGSTETAEIYTYAIHLYEEHTKQPIVVRTKKYPHPQNFFSQFLPGDYVEIVFRKQEVNGRPVLVFWSMRKLTAPTVFTSKPKEIKKEETKPIVVADSELPQKKVSEEEIPEEINDIVDSILSLAETAAKPINIKSFAEQVGVDYNLLRKALIAKGAKIQGDLVYPSKI